MSSPAENYKKQQEIRDARKRALALKQRPQAPSKPPQPLSPDAKKIYNNIPVAKMPAKNNNINIMPTRITKQRNRIKTELQPAQVRRFQPHPERPSKNLLTSVLEPNKVKRLNLPDKGAFNAGLAPYEDGYICVYRPDEYHFKGCLLDKDLNVKKNSYYQFNVTNCADPRLVWTPDGRRLLMTYSSMDLRGGVHTECIRGSIIMDLKQSNYFIESKHFLISPPDSKSRQKNWMPFVHEDKIYLVASVCPHIVYELKLNPLGEKVSCEKVFESEWIHPWFYKEFLRGNTNIVKLDDGNYLGTFHTAVLVDGEAYYDNGCYMFDEKFNVLKCSKTTYLKAEDATEPHFRKKGLMWVCFPVGMVREGKDDVLISMGSNDSAVLVMRCAISDLLSLMVPVY